VFNYRNGPSYRCLHPATDKENRLPGPVLGIYSVIPGIIGLMQVNEALKVATGTGTVLSGKLMMYNALTAESQFLGIEKNAKNFDKDQIIKRIQKASKA